MLSIYKKPLKINHYEDNKDGVIYVINYYICIN